VPLTAERFAPYGDVIAPEQAMEVRHINYGNTDRFHNLANLDLLKDGGNPLVSKAGMR
jgi:ureidoglycolate lyase